MESKEVTAEFRELMYFLSRCTLACVLYSVHTARLPHCAYICRQCVAFCRPGNTLRELHHRSIQSLSEGLADLGVCGSLGPASIARDAYSTFYPHSVGELPPVPWLCPLLLIRKHPQVEWYHLRPFTLRASCAFAAWLAAIE